MILSEYLSVTDIQGFEFVNIINSQGELIEEVKEETWGLYPAVLYNYLAHTGLGNFRVIEAKPLGSELSITVDEPSTNEVVYETCKEFADRIWGKKNDKLKKEFLKKVKADFLYQDDYIMDNVLKRDPLYWKKFV